MNSGAVSIHVSGRGQSTVLIQPVGGPAFNIWGTDTIDVTIGVAVEDLVVWMQPPPSAAGQSSGPAFVVSNVFDFTIQRCWVAPQPGLSLAPDAAVQLGGVIVNTTIRDNTLWAGQGISTLTGQSAFLLTWNLEVLNNKITAESAGISIGIPQSPAFTVSNTRISGNTILLTSATGSILGIETASIAAISSRLEIDSNYIFVESTVPLDHTGFFYTYGIMLGNASQMQLPVLGSVTRIMHNDIFVYWGFNEDATVVRPPPGATGIIVENWIAFEHLVIEGNSIHGVPSDRTNKVTTWNSLHIDVGRFTSGLQRCEIKSNVFEASPNVFEASPSAGYRAANVQIIGDCTFVDNQCVNNNPPPSAVTADVEISADVIIASNNRIKGTRDVRASMALITNPQSKPPAATVLGNICSAKITVNGGGLPSGTLNITA